MQTTTILWCSISLLLALLASGQLAKWVVRLDREEAFWPRLTCDACQQPYSWWQRLPVIGWLGTFGRCPGCRGWQGWTVLAVEASTIALFVAFPYAYLELGAQSVSEVRPDPLWYHGRIAYHLALIALLIVATGTDLRDYFIPDQVTVIGALIGVLFAFGSGDLQIMHLWVDWQQEIPGLQGAYIPEWIKHHHHLHGLANSLAGAVLGGGSMWLLGLMTRIVLGQHAVGLGDATLMMMVGSFIGWHPVVFVLTLAPMCAISVGLLVWLVTGRPYISFGPYLSIATVLVLFLWARIWEPNRLVFSHWPTLLGMAAGSLTTLFVLLLLLRGYRSVPARRL